MNAFTEEKLAKECLKQGGAIQAFLLKLSDALRPLADPSEIQAAAARVLGEHLRASRIHYADVTEYGEYCIVHADYHTEFPSVVGRYRLNDYGPAIFDQLRAGRTLAVNDVRNDPRLTAVEKQNITSLKGVEAFLIEPLHKGGHLAGFLVAHHARPHRWTTEDVMVVQETAERTWAALERARAEEALRESEERLQKAISIESVGVLFFSLDGRIRDANQALERMSGYTIEELRNTTDWAVLTPPEFMDATRQAARELAERGTTAPYEKQWFRKDGSRWWGLFSPTRLQGQGRDSECVEFIVDITERKQAEQRLRENEATLAAIFHQLPFGLGLADATGKWTLTNPPMDTLMAKAIPSTLPDQQKRWRAYDENGEPIPQENWPGKRALRGETVNPGLEMIFTDTDGRERWMRVGASPLRNAAGQTIGAICLVQDIDALKRADEAVRESEAVLRSVTSEARVGLVMVNEERRYLFANQTYADILGLPDANIVGQRVQDVLPIVYEEQIKPRLDRAMAGDRISYELRLPAHGRTGKERFYEVIYEPRSNARGRYVVVVIVDITERKQAQDVLERTVAERTAKLRETIEELEGFSYSITHDMRGPLRAVNGFSDILLEDYGPKLGEGGKHLIDRIQQSVTRMDKLIQDVLQYSRVLRIDLVLGRVNTDRLVRGMLDSYPDLQEPKATVVVQGKLPDVLANEGALTQCFSNLLNNAVKFVRPGTKPQVTVRAEHRASNIRFWIEDNGIGIEPKYQESIFGLFHQLSKNYEGTGVGLSIVRKAIERMGGAVGLESKPGLGSRFWFELKSAESLIQTEMASGF